MFKVFKSFLIMALNCFCELSWWVANSNNLFVITVYVIASWVTFAVKGWRVLQCTQFYGGAGSSFKFYQDVMHMAQETYSPTGPDTQIKFNWSIGSWTPMHAGSCMISVRGRHLEHRYWQSSSVHSCVETSIKPKAFTLSGSDPFRLYTHSCPCRQLHHLFHAWSFY